MQQYKIWSLEQTWGQTSVSMIALSSASLMKFAPLTFENSGESAQQERKARRRIRNASGDTTGQMLSSQHVDCCCCRRNSHSDITDETVTTRLVDHRSVPPVQRVALRRFQNHGTPFTWDKTPYQSATSLFHERMSLRPSYVLHTRRRRVLRPTT